MRIAVLTLTRDRLDYTKHCFASLQENAGCEYAHFVFDNGSSDGTLEWLTANKEQFALVVHCPGNIGITRALNYMLGSPKPHGWPSDEAGQLLLADYDVIVRFDNDCEVTQPDTLKTVAGIAHEYGIIAAPTVLGLNSPPPTLYQRRAGEHIINCTEILGGIFMAIPANLFFEHGFRYDESFPKYTGDEAIVPWWRARGGEAGYIAGLTVNHYETTNGQIARYPEYHDRKLAEIAAA